MKTLVSVACANLSDRDDQLCDIDSYARLRSSNAT